MHGASSLSQAFAWRVQSSDGTRAAFRGELDDPHGELGARHGVKFSLWPLLCQVLLYYAQVLMCVELFALVAACVLHLPAQRPWPFGIIVPGPVPVHGL